MDVDSRQPAAARFEAIVRPEFNALYRAAIRLTRRREDAEDLVQEVLLRAFPELDRLATLESPRGWLLRVQYRIFVDDYRRKLRAPFVAVGDGVDADLAASEDPGPEALAELCQQRQRLARVWHALDRQQRALLALHAEGYSLAELETITGLSRNAISVRLHRARARLAKLIRNDVTGGLQLVQMEG
jgi:RNA polymerase sigma-70 factor (ECF subfamily)